MYKKALDPAIPENEPYLREQYIAKLRSYGIYRNPNQPLNWMELAEVKRMRDEAFEQHMRNKEYGKYLRIKQKQKKKPYLRWGVDGKRVYKSGPNIGKVYSKPGTYTKRNYGGRYYPVQNKPVYKQTGFTKKKFVPWWIFKQKGFKRKNRSIMDVQDWNPEY